MKFKPSLTECAHCLLAQHRHFQGALADRSDSLDRLNQQVGVRAARALFGARHGLTTAQAQQAFQTQVQEAQAQFAHRSRRAPPTASLSDLTNTYVFEVSSDADISALCQLYQADPHVAYAQPNHLMTVQFAPNDPYYNSSGSWNQPYNDLWGLKKMQLGSAWDLTQGQGAIVAVVDTGVDYTHPDLAANVWTNTREIPNNGKDDDANGFIDDVRGWDFAYGDKDPMDGFGHGTHVSGTIAAVGNNNLGIIGVAPQAKIMPVKGLDDLGSGTSSDLAEALVYAAHNGADVINNSWGCGGPCPSNPIIEDAIRTAYGLGAVIVFAAGNSADDVSAYSPQNMTNPKPVVVAASTQEDTPTFFTSVGFLLDVAAPGSGTTNPPPTFDPFRNILSLKSALINPDMSGNGRLIVGQSYVRQAGTSMAAPHVSGLAALILTYRPTFTNEDVRQVLQASADDINSPGFDRETGAGRINATKALGIPSVLQVRIASPIYGTTLSQQAGIVTVGGTAAGTDFKQYALSYAQGLSSTTWEAIGGPVTTPVVNGVLGSWPILDLFDGTAIVKLTAMTRGGRFFQAFTQVALERNPPVPITTNPDTQAVNAIDGNRIVWTDYRNGNYDIYLYDLSTKTEQQITTDTAWQQFPAISQDKIVWYDERNGNEDIYLYDLGTRTERKMTSSGVSHRNPAIAGNRIVWEDYRNGNDDIYLYDLATNTERPITTNPALQRQPAISQDKIVWSDLRNGNDDIYLYDLATNMERRITTDPASQLSPAISGNRIVWEDYRNGNADIYLYDLATNTERRITDDPSRQHDPAISGDKIVWTDFRNGNDDIYLYDLATNTERQITADLRDQGGAAISGDRVVWTDFRNGNWDIYMIGYARSQPPALEPVGNKVIAAGKLLIFPVKASDPDLELLALSAPKRPNGSTTLPKGDVTQNAILDTADRNLIAACVAGTTQCTYAQVQLGDVAGPNGLVPDGKLTSADTQTVEAMLQERANPSGNTGLLSLLNTRMFLWQTTAADADEYPYSVRFRTEDAQGLSDERSMAITVTTDVQNLLANGGFEGGQASWFGWGPNKQLTTETAYTGPTALKVLLGTQVRRLDHANFDVTAGASYLLRAALKTVNVGPGRIYVEVKWRKLNGALLRTDTFGYTSGTTDWVRSSSPIYVAPPLAAKVDVSLVAEVGSGTAYVDAVRLEPVN